ncbi:unnamed protein product, partial [Nesidiocoris tenuis]
MVLKGGVRAAHCKEKVVECDETLAIEEDRCSLRTKEVPCSALSKCVSSTEPLHH